MKNLKMRVGTFIWNLSEAGYLPPLGRLAPIIFGWMIGSKGKRIK